MVRIQIVHPVFRVCSALFIGLILTDSCLLAGALSFFVDESGLLQANDVVNRQFNKKPMKLGYSSAIVWAKIELGTDQELSVFEIARSSTSKIDFYKISEDGSAKYIKSIGAELPFDQRSFNHRFLNATMEEGGIHLAKIYSSSSLNGPVSVRDYKSYLRDILRDNTLISMFYGSLILMILINIILYIAVSESLFLLVACYTLLFALLNFSIDGLSFQFLHPTIPSLSKFIKFSSLVLYGIYTVYFFGKITLFSRNSRLFILKTCSFFYVLWASLLVVFFASYKIAVFSSFTLIICCLVFFTHFFYRESEKTGKLIFYSLIIKIISVLFYSSKIFPAVSLDLSLTMYIKLFFTLQFGLYSYIIGLDIHDRKERNALLEKRALSAEKEKALVERDAIAYKTLSYVSHDIQKPFDLLMASLNIIERQETIESAREKANKTKETLAGIIGSTHDMLQNLRGVSRETTLNLSSINVRELINECLLEKFSFLVSRPEINFDILTKFVRADREKLKRIVNNILENVKDHTKNYKDVKIFIQSTETSEGFFQLTVRNTGSSLSDCEIHKVLSSNYSTGIRKFNHGVGMKVIENFSKIHGGNFTLNSSVEGNWFEINIFLSKLNTARKKD